jgi:hypothetical protein
VVIARLDPHERLTLVLLRGRAARQFRELHEVVAPEPPSSPVAMILPERITYDWMGALDDESLLAAELRLHEVFADEEAVQRKLLGQRYELMRGPAELMSAWDRWSRVHAESRRRKLNPKRVLPR